MKMDNKQMSAEEKFSELYEQLSELSRDNEWGDPFTGGRANEIHMAGVLGHRIAETLSGADAHDEDGECEYKSTSQARLNATYAGISQQDTWEDQVRYLQEEKIAKYKNHYHARYVEGKIVELWKVKGQVVLNLLLPKLERKWNRLKEGKQLADPRLNAQLSGSDIRNNGVRII